MAGIGSQIEREASEILHAEEGKVLSPRNLHLRLRVVEIVLIISLILNLVHWYMSGSTSGTLVTESTTQQP